MRKRQLMPKWSEGKTPCSTYKPAYPLKSENESLRLVHPHSVYICTVDPLDMGTTYQFCYPLRPQQIVAENLDPLDAFAHEQPVQAHAGLRRPYESWDTCTCVEAWVQKCLFGCPLPTQCTEIADGIMSGIVSEVPGMTRLSFFWRSHVYFLSASLGR